MELDAATRIRALLAEAQIEVDGGQDCDITVHNPRFYARVWRHGSLGLGESYMDGWWDCPRLDLFFQQAFAAGLDRSVSHTWQALWGGLLARLTNRQSCARSSTVAKRHYDVGNDLFAQMLDRRMIYTTGRWDHASDLNQAQEAKLDFVCRALDLRPGQRILDIGCGWGGFAKFAAERYGVLVDGVTLSREQRDLGAALCRGLPVNLRLDDYRSVKETYDRIVSLGMFEHVGCKNYRAYFATARHCLRPQGRIFLSTIGSNRSVRTTDPWIERYIFPNSHLPSMAQMAAAMEGLFTPTEWLNWAEDYDRTLMAWHENFSAEWERWRRVYGERFCRMWRYYLLSCAAAFRSRQLHVWQIVLAPIDWRGPQRGFAPRPAYARAGSGPL